MAGAFDELAPAEQVLGLLGEARPDEADLAALPSGRWNALNALARAHRLQPLLHARWQRCAALPEEIRRDWSDAYRASAIAALVQRRDQLALTAALADARIEAVALKGSWLAWHAYRAPAERPMRDIDLLVEERRAARAWEVALALGYRPLEPTRLPLAEWAARFKHLPAVVSPQGTVCELHVRLWDEDGRHPPPLPDLVASAVPDPEEPLLRYLPSGALLAHLAVHAVVTHRFDAGPLLLIDIDRLVKTEQLDWEAIWRRAEEQGWDRALALVLAATDRWIRPRLLLESRCPLAVPPELLAATPGLLTRPPAERERDHAAAKAARVDVTLPEKLRRVLRRRERHAGWKDYLVWLASQSRAVLASRFAPTGRKRSQRIALLERWLRAQ